MQCLRQRVAGIFTITSHHTSFACRPSNTQWAVGLLAIGIIVQFFWKRQKGITSANFPGELQKAPQVNCQYASAVNGYVLCCIFVYISITVNTILLAFPMKWVTLKWAFLQSLVAVVNVMQK